MACLLILQVVLKLYICRLMNTKRYIVHTFLEQTTTLSDVEKVCREAKENEFAAVCIPPLYVKKAKEFLSGTDVKVTTVAGFPMGYAAIESKVAEIVLALVDGVDEIDLVTNISAIKNGDWEFIANEINTIMPLIREKKKAIKVTLECGVLTKDEIIKCCDIFGMAGVDYLKTSTGFAKEGTGIEQVRLIRTHLADSVKIMAEGNIVSFSFAKQLLDAGANLIGSKESISLIEEEKEFMNKY